MRQQLKQLGVTRQYVVIQPTARQLFKCWDNDKFSQVIDAVQRRGYQVVLTSGPAADEMACVDAIARGCETKPVTGLAGKTRFPELGALIDHADLFIGVDSAPGHIAAAVKNAGHLSFWRDGIMYSGVPGPTTSFSFGQENYQPMPERHELDRNKKIPFRYSG
ncbi:lipopolysaccharide core biosynthesis protein [Salmonella sp. NCTC 11881]|nr:lipopolysaccharide core biosynthesis protein [Salmonella sp. NCTC 11881]